MTPQERQLVSELFDRLQSLEAEPRDPEAERLVADGLRRAPHAVYALVQTVLVQDEALRAADERLREYEGDAGAPSQGGFLDNMRDALLGRRETGRGSVPSVRPPENPGWGGAQAAPGYAPQGGSFLGTAAASAAGVIGGALLLNSFRSMFGGQHSGMLESGGGRPWEGGAANSDLARDAGINDIGRGERFSGEQDRAGLFDTAEADYDGGDSDMDDGDFDLGDGDSDLA